MQADMNMLANLSWSGSEASLRNNQMKKSSKIEIGKQEAGKEGGVREKKEYNPRRTVQLRYTNHNSVKPTRHLLQACPSLSVQSHHQRTGL